jgi:hypothetical protein
MTRKNATLVGSLLGSVLFLAVGLPTSLVYGGYAGVLLAGGIFGTPLQSTFLVRGLVTLGMVLGAVGVGSLFTVLGAVVGAGVGVVVESAKTLANPGSSEAQARQ